ncbi:MAG: hypothetical protein SFY92_00650 [Verrucomicrobiae bacterium]|nr:hypothetical protein [Verrucomicrobiae bacterium]
MISHIIRIPAMAGKLIRRSIAKTAHFFSGDWFDMIFRLMIGSYLFGIFLKVFEAFYMDGPINGYGIAALFVGYGSVLVMIFLWWRFERVSWLTRQSSPQLEFPL